MTTLDEKYIQTANTQKEHLLSLQTAFNQLCDQITSEAEQMLAKANSMDEATKQGIMDETRKRLQEAADNLKKEIDLSTMKTRHEMESIHTEREAAILGQLEQMIENLTRQK